MLALQVNWKIPWIQSLAQSRMTQNPITIKTQPVPIFVLIDKMHNILFIVALKFQ